jgi:hypothetical protein
MCWVNKGLYAAPALWVLNSAPALWVLSTVLQDCGYWAQYTSTMGTEHTLQIYLQILLRKHLIFNMAKN